MKVSGKHYRTIWLAEDGWSVQVIDQTKLPFGFEIIPIKSCAEAARAIKSMQVRGAPLIGATAAYGMCLAMREDASDSRIKSAYDELLATRPTAINLKWALERMKVALFSAPQNARAEAAYKEASALCEEDVIINRTIGEYGLKLLRNIAAKKGGVNVLTHCNAGWLGTVDYGTAIAPIYLAHDEGIDVHVWVEETRPRNQGGLTAWELKSHGIKHTYIVDNSGGHVMQKGMVDIVIVGTDRTTRNGDVCNKIGTYQKALCAMDNNVPFYAAVPTPSIDWTILDGVKEIPIEERDEKEVAFIGETRVVPEGTRVANFGFDTTPARLVTGYITEKGIYKSGEISKILEEQEGANGHALLGKR